eukprot:gene16604-22846_t
MKVLWGVGSTAVAGPGGCIYVLCLSVLGPVPFLGALRAGFGGGGVREAGLRHQVLPAARVLRWGAPGLPGDSSNAQPGKEEKTHSRGSGAAAGHNSGTGYKSDGAIGEVARVLRCTSFYEVLEIPMDADDTALRRAKNIKSLATHPDKAGDLAVGAKEAFQKVLAAYNVLSDPDKRRQYDKELDSLKPAQSHAQAHPSGCTSTRGEPATRHAPRTHRAREQAPRIRSAHRGPHPAKTRRYHRAIQPRATHPIYSHTARARHPVQHIQHRNGRRRIGPVNRTTRTRSPHRAEPRSPHPETRAAPAHPKSRARFCSSCDLFHTAKDGDGWIELRGFFSAKKVYVCSSGVIYDVTEYARCTNMFYSSQGQLVESNSCRPSFKFTMADGTARASPGSHGVPTRTKSKQAGNKRYSR